MKLNYAQHLPSNFQVKIIILSLATETEIKNAVPYKSKNMYLTINIYLTQAFTLPFRPVLLLYRNQPTDLQSK